MGETAVSLLIGGCMVAIAAVGLLMWVFGEEPEED